MSHLKHITCFKEALTEKGVTCPIKQQEITLRAYVRALISHQMARNGSFIVLEDQEQRFWKQLDKWNCVSPIKAQLIMTSFYTFINGLRNALVADGCAPDDVMDVVQADDGTSFSLCEMVTFGDLVRYLAKELRGCDE
ncbi:hypothetical protein NFI00_000089 [Salmonella enterica]|nr:hypothetical protein [Salmonella enterica subsp. enterica serovar Minnesota]EJI5696386.1 hypothetical protein [Salmonella enterica]